MGPSMSIDGVMCKTRRTSSNHRASMGPSMSIDGVAQDLLSYIDGMRRFNGAVDEHRRSQ